MYVFVIWCVMGRADRRGLRIGVRQWNMGTSRRFSTDAYGMKFVRERRRRGATVVSLFFMGGVVMTSGVP